MAFEKCMPISFGKARRKSGQGRQRGYTGLSVEMIAQAGGIGKKSLMPERRRGFTLCSSLL